MDDDQLFENIATSLAEYRCQHTRDEDGEGMHLADVFSPPGEGDVALGLKEIEELTEWLFLSLEGHFGLR